MRRIAAGRSTRQVTAKWSLWALRFQARFDRHAGVRRIAMLLYARHGSSSSTVKNNLFRQVVQVEPRVSLSINSSVGATSISNVKQTFNYQTKILMQTRLAASPNKRVEQVMMRGAVITSRTESRERVSRFIEGARREVTSVVERRFMELHHAGNRTTERLVQRSERVVPAEIGHRSLTLRREPVAAAPAAAKAVAQRLLEQERKTASLERAAKPVTPAINVDQLVDQVIQQIDRRVIARRERMGRI